MQEGEPGTQGSGGQTVAHNQHLHAPRHSRVWQETGLKVSWKPKGLQDHKQSLYSRYAPFVCVSVLCVCVVCVCVLQVTFFTNSGSEANELAVLMARLHTGRFDIVSLRSPLTTTYYNS